MSLRAEFDEVLAALHEAAFDDARWPEASALIDEACGIKGNMLIYGSGTSNDDVVIYLARLLYRGERNEELERKYFEEYYPHDERLPRIRTLPDSRLAHVSEVYTEEEKKTSPTYNEALPLSDSQNGLSEYWQEIAAEWRELVLEDTEHAIFEEDSQTSSTVVTDWSLAAVEDALKGQDPVTLLNSLAGLLGKAMVDSERDVLSDILGAEQELDAPWIDIVEVQQEPRLTTRKTYVEPEPVADVTEEQQDAYLAETIYELGLSTRAQSCLERENIRTVRELIAKPEWDLLEYKGLGEGTLNEIKNRLAVKGLYLGMDLDDIDDEEEF